jgi:hypothetical protein
VDRILEIRWTLEMDLILGHRNQGMNLTFVTGFQLSFSCLRSAKLLQILLRCYSDRKLESKIPFFSYGFTEERYDGTCVISSSSRGRTPIMVEDPVALRFMNCRYVRHRRMDEESTYLQTTSFSLSAIALGPTWWWFIFRVF